MPNCEYFEELCSSSLDGELTQMCIRDRSWAAAAPVPMPSASSRQAWPVSVTNDRAVSPLSLIHI